MDNEENQMIKDFRRFIEGAAYPYTKILLTNDKGAALGCWDLEKKEGWLDSSRQTIIDESYKFHPNILKQITTSIKLLHTIEEVWMCDAKRMIDEFGYEWRIIDCYGFITPINWKNE